MTESTLQKMLRPQSHSAEPDPAVDGLAGVLGKAASVAALSKLDTQLEAKSRAARQCDPFEFLETLPNHGLFFQIACEIEGQIGLLVLDHELIEAIDNVLTGELEHTDSAPRAATAIDITLVRPYLEEILAEFSELLGELRAGKPTNTYHLARVKKEPSPHMFPETPYVQIGIDFDFAQGKAKGQLSVLMPSANTEFTSSLPLPGESASAFRAAFNKTVESAPATLDVVLYRKKMHIGQILKLKKGDVLEVPARALENLSIESRKGKICKSLMHARLGEYQEMRAAKITRIGEVSQDTDTTKLLEPSPGP